MKVKVCLQLKNKLSCSSLHLLHITIDNDGCEFGCNFSVVFFFPVMECPAGSPPEAVLIDSLLSVDQYRGADKATPSDSDEKNARDIVEVAASTELILPKGSLRTTSSVRHAHLYTHTHTQ